jgi:DUF4097 and DUF4098 domain-containing protein YvlB
MMRPVAGFLLLTAALACGRAQEAPGERVSVPFSDPSRPKTLKASVMNGGITVKGYDGKEVIVEAHGKSGESRRHGHSENAAGMRRLEMSGSGLNVEESENVITVATGWGKQDVSLTIQTPYATSLKLSVVNGGDIVVDHVLGDVEINNTNGAATATHITGAAVVHSLNGRVLVTIDKASDRPMSFSSLNGDIDVTLPADVRAQVKMKTDNGDVYSDFEVKLDGAPHGPVTEDGRNNGRGKYKVRFDRATHGSINGGGPEMTFTTFNGNIYIRKAK